MLFELFITFIQIGFTSFGGMSMVPLINYEMLSHGWMSAEEVLDIVAIAEITPGPLGVNCATFAGMRVSGFLGAVCANLGVLVPTLTVGLMAAIFIERFRDSRLLQSALYGIRPMSLGMIAATVLTLSLSTYLEGSSLQFSSILIAAIVSFILYKWNLSIPKTILLAAGLGLLLVR